MNTVIAIFLLGSLAFCGCERSADADLPTQNERAYDLIRGV